MTIFYRNIFRLAKKSNLIKFDQVWSILDRSDPKKIKNEIAIFILSVNVTIFYSTFLDWWEIHFDQVWSILHRSNTKKSKTKTKQPFLSFLYMWQIFIGTFLYWRGNPIWSSLIHFGQIWSKKNQKQSCHFYPFWKCDIVS